MEILEIIMDIIIMDIMYWNYVLELYMEIIEEIIEIIMEMIMEIIYGNS